MWPYALVNSTPANVNASNFVGLESKTSEAFCDKATNSSDPVCIVSSTYVSVRPEKFTFVRFSEQRRVDQCLGHG